jgi:CHAT domain-containing protein/Tfp pilus assembly protein PilF
MTSSKSCLWLAVGLFAAGFLTLKSTATTPDINELNQQASTLCAQGRYVDALTVATNALRQAESSLGTNNPQTQVALMQSARILRLMGRYSDSKPLYAEVLSIREKELGETNRETAKSLTEFGELYRNMGNYEKAETLSRRALNIDAALLGTNHEETATCLDNLGFLLVSEGKYEDAEPFLQQALAIRERVLGLEHRDTAKSLDDLAEAYRNLSQNTRAAPLFEQALKINQKVLGENHPETAISLNAIALIKMPEGDYDEAERLLQQAIQIRIQTLGDEHPDTLISQGNLAGLYDRIKDFPRAENLLQHVVDTETNVLGLRHRSTAASILQLGGLYLEERKFSQAKSYLDQALELRTEIFGKDSPETIHVMSFLGNLALRQYDYPLAEKLLKQVLECDSRVLGLENPRTKNDLHNLAFLYRAMNRYSEAEHLYLQALGNDEPGPDFGGKDRSTLLRNLTFLYLDWYKEDHARVYAKKALEAKTAELASVLAFSSERQRIRYVQTADPYSALVYLQDVSDIAQAVLRWKGISLDSILDDRRAAQASDNPEDEQLLQQLAAARDEFEEFSADVPGHLTPERRKQFANKALGLLAQEEALDTRVARSDPEHHRARWGLNVTVPQVQAAIPKNAALVEFVLYAEYIRADTWAPSYGAVLLTSSGPPKWVYLGAASWFTTLVQRYQTAIRSRSDDATLSEALSKLCEDAWQPIETALPRNTELVLISPDGLLNFVSFATLLDSDHRFVGEKYSFCYLASGRDLLRKPTTTTNRDFEVFAAPDYGKQAPDSHLRFAPLPVSGEEGPILKNAAQRSDCAFSLYTGKDATKSQVRALRSPYILHFATHGFFLPGIFPGGPAAHSLASTSEDHNRVVLANPMRRSGLALAGAQTTIDAWQRGSLPAIADDGILTAEEVGSLDLSGTWLVSLSACDTGIGASTVGEGVLGLRRGFIEAGVQNLVMTLWPVYTAKAVDFTEDFYTRIQKTHSPARALSEVQKSWLSRLRQQNQIRDAVYFAGPYILSIQGPVQ